MADNSIDWSNRLRQIVDHHEIVQILAKYAHSADDRRWRDWAALFSDDATVVMPQGSYEGRKGLGEWAAHSLAAYQGMMHFSGNHDITLNGDTAACRSKVIAICVPDGTDCETNLMWGGVYSVKLIRIEEAWKIARLQFDLVWSRGEDQVEGPR